MQERQQLDRRIPADGEWPCQTQPDDGAPQRLKHALYVLMRDHVQPGALEEVAIQVTDARADTRFTNKHLEAYAAALATFLTQPATEVPR